MRTRFTLLAASLPAVSCSQPTRQESPAPPVTHTGSIGLTALTAAVRDNVQDVHRNVVIGEKTVDRIRTSLLQRLPALPLAAGDTNLLIDVDCGDPVYHVRIQVENGIVADVSVTLTPICLELEQ